MSVDCENNVRVFGSSLVSSFEGLQVSSFNGYNRGASFEEHEVSSFNGYNRGASFEDHTESWQFEDCPESCQFEDCPESWQFEDESEIMTPEKAADFLIFSFEENYSLVIKYNGKKHDIGPLMYSHVLEFCEAARKGNEDLAFETGQMISALFSLSQFPETNESVESVDWHENFMEALSEIFDKLNQTQEGFDDSNGSELIDALTNDLDLIQIMLDELDSSS